MMVMMADPYKNSPASLGSATQDNNVDEKADWLDEAFGQAVAASMLEGVDERFAVAKHDELDMLLPGHLEQKREEVQKDREDVVAFVPDVAKKALQPMETSVREMVTAVVSRSHLVARVASLEGNCEQNRKDVTGSAVRFFSHRRWTSAIA